MTADGGMNQETTGPQGPAGPQWDEARIALRRVSKFLNDNADVAWDMEELRALENYLLIPRPVREALEGLSPDEHQLLKRIINTLCEHHFYLENIRGEMECY
jgi:hypothetical protein